MSKAEINMKWTAMRATLLACYLLHGGFVLLWLHFRKQTLSETNVRLHNTKRN
jgi:hypothetical protein